MTDMIQGSIVALITPFHEDGSVNFEKLKELVEWHIANKTDGILVLGTTGESSTMTHEEDDSVVACVIETVNKRVPVIVGAGSNNTATMLKKSIDYEKMGADQLLLISPYYNKTNEEGMILHFKTVADAVHIPIILYNIPGRTGCSISEHAVSVLSKHPNIKGIKEASGNMSYAMNISRYLNDDFVMYSGNDDIIVPMLSLGSSGVISVLANILPEQTHELVKKYLDGDTKGSLALQQQYLDLIHALFVEVNPIPVKEAMNQMGMNAGGYHLPLTEMSEDHKELIKQRLEEAGLL
ncbi:4-hydroxy-tetrahydrodipicolinate synthase [uncultured Dubosiella sp.]|jgi:4-hydroxy-tetrahydrodipicolinate synthase|uniref:4-hydroxy-tetrahydrodipicolinate synthase n=1 Tax=uncultured Dubosiella sp. TaxID=1937011 RepID=UPI00207FBA5C|nr:4-hydroxy-tetrahydrodipicolinate synthase [uncultured Dubosiella sp.]GJM57132.1 4-hydroxy-tetrahydrodipicolinate synthase [Erysipelotrichaceae bacterium OPF54]